MQKVISAILIGILIGILIYVFWPSSEDLKDSDFYYSQSVADSLSLEIEYLKEDREKLKDSLFGLHVEKGFLEVELNKSRAELDNRIVVHEKAKAKRDTVTIVQNCDSLIEELKNRYLPLSDSVSISWINIDSLSGLIAFKGDTIFKLQDDVTKIKDHQIDVLLPAKKKKKIPLVAALVGFVAGVITALSLK